VTLKTAILYPPSNIERIISQLQDDIFRTTGLVSPLALPVMLPIRFLSDSVSYPSFQSVFEGINASFTVQSAGFRLFGGVLYLYVRMDEEGERLMETLESRLEKLESPQIQPPFSPARGFFLCYDEESQGLEGILQSLGPPPSFRFSSFGFSLVALTIADPPMKWWSHVSWEMEGLIKVRKSRPR